MGEYEERAREGREECLKKIRETDRKISSIYREAAKEMGAKAAGAKEGGLTKRWALDMQKSLTESSRRLGHNMLREITGAALETAAIPGRVDGEWLRDAYTGAGGNPTGLNFRNMFTRTSDEALRMVLSGRAYLDGKSLSSRIWTQTGRLENGINQVIQQGIAQKKSTEQIARELEQYVNPSAHETLKERRERVKNGVKLPFAGNIEYNCQRLARTSVNHAYFLAMKESAKLNPFCRAVHWELDPMHFERQVLPFGTDICDEYATHDEGLGMGNWPASGVPLPHAQCLCDQWPDVEMSLDECADRLRSWLDGNEDAELDASYAAWKEAMLTGMPDKRLKEIRDDAGEVRKQLMTRIAGRDDVRRMSVAERTRLFDELNNASEEELRQYPGNIQEGDVLNKLLNKLRPGGTMNTAQAQTPKPAPTAAQTLKRPMSREEKIKAIHGQKWYKQLDAPDKMEVQKVFANMSDAELEFWSAHGELVKGSFYSRGTGEYYDRATGKVTLNMSRIDGRIKSMHVKSNIRALFHETGHLFDNKAYKGTTITREMPDLAQKLENDFLRYANQELRKCGMKPVADLGSLTTRQKMILSRSVDGDIKNGISDIAGALTGHGVAGRYGHDATYWQRDHALESEAIAHMFEATAVKGKKLQCFEEVFPDSVAYFRQTIDRLEGRP